MIRKSLAFALALALLLCAVPVFADNVTVMYVYTDNGKGLNVRSGPFVGNNIIDLAYFGSQIRVKYFLDNGWACIEWSGISEAYVQSRYLQWDKPASRSSYTPYATVAPTAAPYINNGGYTNYGYNGGVTYQESYADTLAVLNAEFRTARQVTPFTVSVRPSRASGWVNFRWAPSKDTPVITTYRTGATLTVIAETQSWYQATDPSTGAVGFIMKTYTVRQR